MKYENNDSKRYRKGIFGMKIKNTELTKRIIATALSLIMVIGLLPFSAFAAETNEDNIASSLQALSSISSVPDEFNITGDPYGYGDRAFNLSPQNELFLMLSQGSSSSLNAELWEGYAVGDTLNKNTRFDSQLKTGSGYLNWSFVQAVGFDPYGIGRDTHVAYVGLETKDATWTIRLNVINALTMEEAEASRKIVDASWMKANTEKGLQNFNAANFLSITAGDYDGDGKDTIVVFGSGDGQTSTLMEFYLEGGDSESIRSVGAANNLLHWTYQSSNYGGPTMANTTIAAMKLQADLATGDFDGDKKDDLAVVSYVGEAYNMGGYEDKASSYAAMYHAYLGISLGGGDGTSIVNKTSNCAEFAVVNKNCYGVDDEKMDLSLTAPSVAIGDVDGDGYDEAVVAGFGVDVWHHNDTPDKVNNLTLSAPAVAIYDVTKNGKKTTASALMFEQFKDEGNETVINTMTHDIIDSLEKNFSNDLNTEYIKQAVVMPQLSVETVKTNGAAAPAHIFLNGTYASYDVSGTLTHVYTPESLTKDDDKAADMNIRFTYIANTAVGVFDDNTVGREQIAMTVIQKDGSDNIYSGDNHDDYAYMFGMIGGTDYSDVYEGGEIASYGVAGSFDYSGFDEKGSKQHYKNKEDYEFYNLGTDATTKNNALLVAVDVDSDGVVAKYAGKSFTYADPGVLAVLQAPPYFDEFGFVDPAETVYSFSTTHTIGQNSSNTSSFSVGISSEVAAPGVKVAMGSGYTGSWEKSFMQSFSTTYTTEFIATSKNAVVMQRTPVIIYRYIVQDENGEFPTTTIYNEQTGEYELSGESGKLDAQITIAIPAEPVYAMASVEEYNAYVNSEAYIGSTTEENRLKPITDTTLITNEGHPENYRESWEGGTVISKTEIQSSPSMTGGIMSELSEGNEVEEGESSSHGFYFDLTVSAGAMALVAEVWAGVSTNTEHNWSSGTFTSTVNEETSSGMVAHVGNVDGFSDEILKQYGFTWRFGHWTLPLDKNGVPVYGYSVTNLKSGLNGPQNLKAVKATADGESVLLTWDEAVDSSVSADKYNIYLIDETGEYGFVGEATGTTYTYKIPETNQHAFHFAVTALYNGNESVYSERAVYYRDGFGKSAYDIAVDNGFEGTEEEWLASLIGADGEDGQDGIGISNVAMTENGELIVTLSDGKTINLGNVVGAAGQNGVGVSTISINELGELVVLLTDGTETNLGIVIGNDGITPHIGENGNWWIGETDTGVKATGEKGDTGVGIKSAALDQDGNLIITLTDDSVQNLGKIVGTNGTDGADGSDGKDGINGKDGTDGEDGKDGATPYIGENGNWWIGDTDTGVRATPIDVSEITLDAEGNLIYTLSDGTTKSAGSVIDNAAVQAMADVNEGGITQEDINTVKALANVATILSSISLLWNLISLFALIGKKKKVMTP